MSYDGGKVRTDCRSGAFQTYHIPHSFPLSTGLTISNASRSPSLLWIILEWNLLPWEIGYVCGTCRMSTHVGMAGRRLMDDISHVGHMT